MYHHMNVNLLFHETLVPELSGRGKFSCLRYVKIRILLPHFVIRERKRRSLPFLVEKRRNLTFPRPYVQKCTYGRGNTPRSDALASQRRHISTIHRPQHPRGARGPRDAPRVSRGQNREDGRNPRPNPSHGGILGEISPRMPPWLELGADWQQLRGFGGFLVPARPSRGVAHAAMQWWPGGEAVAALDGDPKRCGSPQIWATVGSNHTMYD